MIRVLVTGVGGGVGQGIVKALRRVEGLDIEVFAADMSPLAAGLYTADRAMLVPAAASAGYGDAIIDICRREHIDFYLPGTDIELPFASQEASRIESEAGTAVYICPPEAIAVADDKYLTYTFLRRHGFAAPETWLPADVDPAALRFPVIVKPRNGFRSIGVTEVRDAAELAARLAWTDAPVVQEYLATADDEYTCTIAVVKGQASRVLALKRVLRSGDTYRATPVQSAAIEDYVTGVALALGVRGSCNFQLRVDRGVPKIFEINARSSGTTPLCAELGFNPVEFVIKTHLGIPYTPSVRWDVTILRHWAETIVPHTEIERLREAGSIVPRDATTVDLRRP